MQCIYSETGEVTHIRCNLGNGMSIGANFQRDDFCVVTNYRGDRAGFEAGYSLEDGFYANQDVYNQDVLIGLMVELMNTDEDEHPRIMRDLADLIA